MSLLFFFGQQLNEWTAPLGFFTEQWRLLVSVSSLLFLFSFYLLPFLVVHYKKEQLYRLMPTPVTSPILGRILGHLEPYWNASEEVKKLPPGVLLHHIFEQFVPPMQKAGESLFLLRSGPFPKWVILLKGEAAKALLSGSRHLQKSPEYEFFKDFIGESLLTGNVAKWKIHRKMITPAFHLEILNKFLPTMNVHSRVFSSVVASKMDASTGQALLPDIRQLTSTCTLDILCEIAMGVQLNSQGAFSQGAPPTAAHQFAEALFTMTDLICERVLTPWLHPNFLFRLSALGRKSASLVAIGQQFTNSVISERKVTLSKQIEGCATVEQATARLTDGKRLTFLDILLVNHLKGCENALNLTSIEEEVFLFMVAGMDTTATTLQMALLLLGLHADKQELIHQELDGIFADDDDRHISMEDIRQMTYLEMCIKEIIRLYPSIPLVGRTLLEDCQIDKYLVPEGATVIVNIAVIQRDPEMWTEADDFIPERFSADSRELGLSHSYLPFSVGPRNCIGSRYAMLSLKIFLATLLRHYTIHSLTAQEDVQVSCFITAKPNSPISIEFTQRK